MTLEQFLQSVNSRLSCDDRWLYWNQGYDYWVVCVRPPYAKRTRILYRGSNLENALAILKGGD